MHLPSKMQDIIAKYHTQINDKDFDVVYQDLYDAGGRAYIKLFNELLHDAEVEFKAPFFLIFDDKLYKRLD